MGTFIADLVLQILSFVSQNERENIKKRQREGIATARARGIRFGRPVKKPPENFDALVIQWGRGNVTMPELMRLTDMTETTLYRRLRVYRAAKRR